MSEKIIDSESEPGIPLRRVSEPESSGSGSLVQALDVKQEAPNTDESEKGMKGRQESNFKIPVIPTTKENDTYASSSDPEPNKEDDDDDDDEESLPHGDCRHSVTPHGPGNLLGSSSHGREAKSPEAQQHRSSSPTSPKDYSSKKSNVEEEAPKISDPMDTTTTAASTGSPHKICPEELVEIVYGVTSQEPEEAEEVSSSTIVSPITSDCEDNNQSRKSDFEERSFVGDEEEEEEVRNSPNKCLVCFSIISHPPTSAECKRSPLEQLHDLLKVFRITPLFYEEALRSALPPQLFCPTCMDQIVTAVETLLQIERLQQDFECLSKTLHSELLSSFQWLPQTESSTKRGLFDVTIQQMRKTLVQCFSSCQVMVEPVKYTPPPPRAPPRPSPRGRKKKLVTLFRPFPNPPRRPEDDHNNTKAEIFDMEPNSFLEFLSPVTILTEEEVENGASNARKQVSFSLPHSGGVTSDFDTPDEDFPSITDKESDSEFVPKKKRVSSNISSSRGLLKAKRQATRAKKKVKVVVDSDSSDSDEEGPRLGHSIDGTVKSKSPKRQRPKTKTVAQNLDNTIATTTENKSFNKTGNLIAYDCPHCQKKMLRSGYLGETGEYLFKCSPDCCEKICSNFPNLIYHHEASCPSKPAALRSKSRRHKRSSSSIKAKLMGTTGAAAAVDFFGAVLEAPPPHARNGFVHDEKKQVIAFDCPRCLMKMSRSDYQKENGDYEFKCLWGTCGKITDNFANLMFHHGLHCPKQRITMAVSNHLGELESFSCQVCSYSISCLKEDSMGNAPPSVDSNRVYTCQATECAHLSHDLSEFRSHHENHCLKKLQDTGKFENPVYSVKHRPISQAGLVKFSSKQKQGKIYPYNCEICGKGYERPEALENHRKFHQGTMDYSCTLCIRKFCTEGDLDKHVRHHELSKEQKFNCPPEKILLPERKTICPQEGNLTSYKCQHCDREIPKADCTPQVGGENESKYKCWSGCCERFFKNFTYAVIHHVSSCSERKLPSCEICHEKFSAAWKLKSHVEKIHMGIDHKNVFCDQCGKAFSSKSALLRHMTVHTDDRPFACHLCPKTYKWKKKLKEHLILHECENPYMCSVCGKTFRKKCSMKSHEKTHNVQYLAL